MRRLVTVVSMLVVGCGEADRTQAVVCVDADEGSLAQVDEVTVTVRDEGGDEVLRRTAAFRSARPEAVFPLRIPIVPDGDADRRFEVEVTLASDQVLSRQRLRGGFERDALLVYEVSFEEPCVGSLDCDAGETCNAGACVSAEQTGTVFEDERSLDRACPPTIVGSRDGYSTRAQGFLGWYYGYYDRATASNDAYDPSTDFQLMEPQLGDQWRVPGMALDPWLPQLTREGVQPGRTETSWTVPIRRFVAPADGDYRFDVRFRNADPRDPNVEREADGIRGLVWIEGTLREEEFIAPDDGSEHTMSVEASLLRGQRVDHGLDSVESPVFDPTSYVVEVTREQ